MPIIYRTARLPVVYKARVWSLANIFHIACTIFKFLLPILACYFYISNNSGSTFDSETPLVTPGNILYFNLIDENERSIVYPPVEGTITDTIITMVHPYYDHQNRVSFWKINVKVANEFGASPEAVSVVILFNFTVNLRKYATNTIQTIGSFSKTFVSGVGGVVCHGDLVLEQSEMIEFRGSFSETNPLSMDLSNYDSLSDIIAARDEMPANFFVDWDDPFISLNTNTIFELELLIRVKDLTIYHSIPLVSSIETVLIVFLATYLLSAGILDALQGFIFRHGIIKSWAIPLYRKAPKMKGGI